MAIMVLRYTSTMPPSSREKEDHAPGHARACAAGADAIVVSNHGGRQLDGAPPTVEALPGIVAAAGERVEVLFDSGVRRGGDIAKALSLGATACLPGRPQGFALAARDEAGLVALLAHMELELNAILALLGGMPFTMSGEVAEAG